MMETLRRRIPVLWKVRLHRLARALRDMDPSARVVTRHWGARSPEFAILCVYRKRNAVVVRQLIDGAGRGVQCRLWALDDVHDDLAGWTIGVGAGTRTEILNRCFAELPDRFDGFVVLCDDDVLLTRGDLRTAVEVARRSRFAISQPAHDHRSTNSHVINETCAFSIARSSTFVEIGPIAIFDTEHRQFVLPMDETFGMGPGLEACWMRLARERDDFRLGIVDAVRMRHLGTIGSEYDLEGSLTAFRDELTALGGSRRALRTLQVWRPWQASVPW